jgi:hypothetical protein
MTATERRQSYGRPIAGKTDRRWWLLRLILLFIVVLSVLLAIAGAVYEAIASARDRHDYPPPGELVDIGGRKLHINCTGQGSLMVSNLSRQWRRSTSATMQPAALQRSSLGLSMGSWTGLSPERFSLGCTTSLPKLVPERDEIRRW